MNNLFCIHTELAPGTTELLSATALAAVDPRAAATALAKYDDTPQRRRLRDTVVPSLNLRWSEVVFLSPVHPHAIWRCWRELTGRSRASLMFWSVPATALPAGAVVLDRTITATGDPIDASEVTRFDPVHFRTLRETPPANRAWLAKLAASGRSGAWFMGIPHVLSPTAVPLTDATIIDWADAPEASDMPG